MSKQTDEYNNTARVQAFMKYRFILDFYIKSILSSLPANTGLIYEGRKLPHSSLKHYILVNSEPEYLTVVQAIKKIESDITFAKKYLMKTTPYMFPTFEEYLIALGLKAIQQNLEETSIKLIKEFQATNPDIFEFFSNARVLDEMLRST